MVIHSKIPLTLVKSNPLMMFEFHSNGRYINPGKHYTIIKLFIWGIISLIEILSGNIAWDLHEIFFWTYNILFWSKGKIEIIYVYLSTQVKYKSWKVLLQLLIFPMLITWRKLHSSSQCLNSCKCIYNSLSSAQSFEHTC